MNENITPAEHLKGTLSMPPDKSIAQRATIFSLLSKETSVIENYPVAEDPQTALRCVEQLGARVERSDRQITISGIGRNGIKIPDDVIDCGNSGTVMRLLSGIVAGSGISAVLTGDASLSGRPMKRIIDPLAKMGAVIKAAEGGFPPLVFEKRVRPLQPIKFRLPVASAQLKSCVLLAGLFGRDATQVIESVPSRNHTETMLRLPVTVSAGETVISSRRAIEIPAQTLAIPGDFSAAAFWLVAGSITKNSNISITGTGVNPTRCAALHILRRMGADITINNERKSGEEPVADLKVRSARLNPVEIRPDEIPNAIDELPVLSVAMAFADGVSRITGAEELRFKESNRLAAIEAILTSTGVKVEAQEDGITIYGNPDRIVQSARHDSCHDHRIAMSAAILSLKADGVSEVWNADAAAVSYPEFWSDIDILSS